MTAQESKETVQDKQQTLSLVYSQGCFQVKGILIENCCDSHIIDQYSIPSHFLKNRLKRDGESHHLTVISQKESNHLINERTSVKQISIEYILQKGRKYLKLQSKHFSRDEQFFFDLGIGKCNAKKSTAYFAIILWPELLKFRRYLKLCNDDYCAHITIGFNPSDVHSRKSILTLLQNIIKSQKTEKELAYESISMFHAIKRLSIKKDSALILECMENLLHRVSQKRNVDENQLFWHSMVCKILMYRCFVHGQCHRLKDCLDEGEHILHLDEFFIPALIAQAIALLSMKRPLEASQIFRHAQFILKLYENCSSAQQKESRIMVFFGTVNALFHRFFFSPLVNINNERSENKEREKQISEMNASKNEWCARMRHGLQQCKRDTLIIPLSPRIRISIKYLINNSSVNGIMPEQCTWNTTILPRNFSWAIDGWLCGVSLPKSVEQMKAFESMNIGLIVTIFDSPLPMLLQSVQMQNNIRFLHLKTENYQPPKLFDVLQFMDIAEQTIFCRRKAVLVHCGGGKGRAGTGLACFLVKWGLDFDYKIMSTHNVINIGEKVDRSQIPEWTRPSMTAAQAINHLQIIRPGSVESTQQEKFVKLFCNHLWANVQKKLPAEICDEQKSDCGNYSNNNININNNSGQINGQARDETGLKTYPYLTDAQIRCLQKKKYPELILLVGIPGAGKSLFAKMMNTLNTQQAHHSNKSIVHEWRIANQDELGERQDVECEVRKWLTHKIDRKIGLIIDRCNVCRKDRKHWISCAFAIKKCVAVYFDVDIKTCEQRIRDRKFHPTINNRSAISILRLIRSFSNNLEIPSIGEGFCKIYTIKNTNDLLKCCTEFGCLPELIQHFIPNKFFKYPRTAHLWDTGAATRDDLRLDEALAKQLYMNGENEVIVCEKLDGANLGISLSANFEIICQHRGHRITFQTSNEYSKLKQWLKKNEHHLCSVLEPNRLILFGEWLQMKHSIEYQLLTDYFFVFDIYDKYEHSFYSRQKLEKVCESKFQMTPIIGKFHFHDRSEIEQLLNETKSAFTTDESIEGLYLKIDDEHLHINLHRCKLVRSQFIQGIKKHFMHNKPVYNTLRIY